MAVASPRTIEISPPDEDSMRLWTLTLDLADSFGDRDWVLVGGLMVQLHGFEREDEPRLTEDIDVLGEARRSPRSTARLARIIEERGGEVRMPPRSNEQLGYRFELEGQVIEVLGPDGLKADPPTLGKLTTLQIDGGRQALHRAETVLVVLGERPPAPIRRPDLLGAILLKARVVAVKRPDKFDSDREDLIRLLTYVDDPRELAETGGLTRNERGWLRRVDPLLDF